jgi:hypothetical protein
VKVHSSERCSDTELDGGMINHIKNSLLEAWRPRDVVEAVLVAQGLADWDHTDCTLCNAAPVGAVTDPASHGRCRENPGAHAGLIEATG